MTLLPSHFRTSGVTTVTIVHNPPAPSRVAPVRRLSIENLNEEAIGSSRDLYTDGHYEAAVSEAFKSIEVRVRSLAGSNQSGIKLMGEVFGGSEPRVSVSTSFGQSRKDEQEGSERSSVGRCWGCGIQGRTTSSDRRTPAGVGVGPYRDSV